MRRDFKITISGSSPPFSKVQAIPKNSLQLTPTNTYADVVLEIEDYSLKVSVMSQISRRRRRSAEFALLDDSLGKP